MTAATLDSDGILDQAADRLRAELVELAGQITGPRLAEMIEQLRKAARRASAQVRKAQPPAPEARPWVAPATGHPTVARYYAGLADGQAPTKPARSLGRRGQAPTRVGPKQPTPAPKPPAPVQRAPRLAARRRDHLRRLARPLVAVVVLLALLVLLAGSAPDRDRGGGSAGDGWRDRTGAHFSLDRGDRSCSDGPSWRAPRWLRC